MKKTLLFILMLCLHNSFAQSVFVTTFSGIGLGTINGPSNIGQQIARFNQPYGIAMDINGNSYVADYNNHTIRKITPAGLSSTFAGSGTAGNTDATGTAASFNHPTGVAVDASGNVYVADADNDLIRKITSAGVVSTFAGSGTSGSTDATGTAASFYRPCAVALDVYGNLYVADYYNHKIRKITSAGVVTTLAGSGTIGSTDATGTAASFNYPEGVAVDLSGNIYVADLSNKIRKITSAGVVTTFAGSGAAGSADGTGTAATFNGPTGVAVDLSDNVYVADMGSHKIRKITSGGVVTTVAGSGAAGSADGTGTAAYFYYPRAIALDGVGNMVIADMNNHKIRKITSSGIVTTLAGSGIAGNEEGEGTAASYNSPVALVFDGSGNAYVADRNNHSIRKVDSFGEVTTFVGSQTIGNSDGTGAAAGFNYPSDIKMDASGNLYVADQLNHKIRKITPAGVVSTFAGSGSAGSTDATGTAASFNLPSGIAIDGSDNLYVVDQGNHKIRKITPAGVVSTVAGSGTTGSTDGVGTGASFNSPRGIAIDASGNLYVTDRLNHKVRKITPAGVVTTLAGDGTSGSTNGTGTGARFNNPYGITIDASGNLYLTDYSNHLIRKITSAGVVTTLAGNGTAGSTDDTEGVASFNNPTGLAFNSSGNLYVADFGNAKIRKMIIPSIASVSNNRNEFKIQLYPNPGTEELNFNIDGEKTVRVLDLNGSIQLEEIIYNNKIQIQDLQKGVYIIEIIQNSKIFSTKFVKQ